MLIVHLFYILCYNYRVYCELTPITEPVYSEELVKCVTDTVSKYYASQPQKLLTYVGNTEDYDEFLPAINYLNVVSLFPKRTSRKLPILNEGYILSVKNYTDFAKRFPQLAKESTWNPEARILIIVKSLKYLQLKDFFNKLLHLHVNNVVILNGTADAHLYAYNPFDKFGCGKHYDEIIEFGMCADAHKHNLFPNKYITEMENCTLTVAMPHWPPYSMFPPNGSDQTSPLAYGLEPYLLQLVGKMEKFTLNIIPSQNNATYSTVSADMEAIGPLKTLQNNEAEIILGGLLLLPSSAEAFDYIYEFLAYVDEIRFLVRKASFVEPWQNVYLEFDATVWMLIVLSLVFYSMIMIILLREEDKSLVVLKLLDNMILHSCNIHCKSTVKCIFIIWVWYAYLINAFYQSSLVSLTTDPIIEDQILTEADILHYNLKPCFSEEMEKYYMESTQSRYVYNPIPGCNGSVESVTKVMKSKDYYTLYLYGFFMYNRQDFFDKYGNPYIYPLKEPYSKVIYCMYFYKGFPLIDDIRLSALKLRESGLADKALADINYVKIIKHHYEAIGFEPRFAFPWSVYITGCSIATFTLIVELLSKYK